ncbi:MAG: thiamine pyrophosphate-dependent enzyme [Acidimicrobiales bacterium]|nr:thiamine pyrophosphate-dependent enzyme [Acidimicrobiales bacterium]RUA24813.1 MAG: thiamine pyrophosphate-binding protein [Actinomycetota bacterium]
MDSSTGDGERTGGRLLVDCLLAQGVDTAFGVPGESFLAVLDAFHDVTDELRFVICRQEGGAAFMAEAYGKLTGRPGICFVTRGPGATNASIGVHTAMQDSTPMVLFVGQVRMGHRGLEAFQEIEYRSFFDDIAKWVVEIESPDDIPAAVERAFLIASSDRPGPVVVSLPEDMLRAVTAARSGPMVHVAERVPVSDDVAALCDALERAERPVLLVGGGGWTAAGQADLLAFAGRNDLPVVVTFRRHDLFDNTDDRYVGEAGVGMPPAVRQTLVDSDVVVAVNARFGEMATDAYTLFGLDDTGPDGTGAPGRRSQVIVHVHASAAEFGKVVDADITVHAGPNEICRVLAGVDLDVKSRWKGWLGERRAAFLETLDCPPQLGDLDMGVVLAWLRDNLPDDVVVTNGAGNYSVWPNKFLLYGARASLLATQNGTMGYGLPAAVAAKVVDPERTVVCFTGDGDLQMNLAALGTGMQAGAQPIVLVVNNGTYGTIRMHQEIRHPGRVIGTDIVNPDFVALAGSYGIHAERVTETEGFAPAFQRALESPTGALLDLVTATEQLNPRLTVSEARSRAV